MNNAVSEVASTTGESVPQTNTVQYSRGKVLLVWILATLPVWSLSWGIMPMIAEKYWSAVPFAYWLGVAAGLGWMAFVTFRLVAREKLTQSSFASRFWLNRPISPKTGQPRAALFWWLIPCLAFAVFGVLLQVRLMMSVNSVFAFEQPILWWPHLWPAYANLLELVSPQYASHGFVAFAIFCLWLVASTVAEEFFFRGFLLPRMRHAFGKRDGIVNNMLYLIYSLYQPWMFPVRVLEAITIAVPVRRYRSLQFGLMVRGFTALTLFALVWLGLHEAPLKPLAGPLALPMISRNPQPDAFQRPPLAALPKFNSRRLWFSVDLRSRDVSQLDLRGLRNDLAHADFDSRTVWPFPNRMPHDFNPQKVLEWGRNPGLGVRTLHAQGITGRGVGIGIVDHYLLTQHSEIRKSLKWYEEINRLGSSNSHMHGCAVSSLATGEGVGVAPQADLYFIGVGDNFRDLTFMAHDRAQGVRRLLEINRRLPEAGRIRAISLSYGPPPGLIGYEDFISAVHEAEREGIFVAWCDDKHFPIFGLAVAPNADREDLNSYSAPAWVRPLSTECLFVPMDSRTTASPTGTNDYTFYSAGGSSWTVPYAAGVYALIAQQNPKITPEQFWSTAIATGYKIQAGPPSHPASRGLILDPVALSKAFRN